MASDGSVYAAGYIDGTGTFNFGNGVTATGTYWQRKRCTGEIRQHRPGVVGSNRDRRELVTSSFAGVSVASGGYVYAAGDISGTGTYNFGNGATATGTYIGSNIVLVGY